uniref:Uncharacterized protein n=2 Tax=Amphora coffeiformis TaxID=265554 RepID=A0A7S3PCQ2_9STRA
MDDAHKREEEERRAKRKAAKSSKSASQLEKERKAKEHREKILKQTGSSKNIKGSEKKSSKPGSAPLTGSNFQKLFETRSQGFQIEFRFRNAPPRPPVGPIFVGQPLDVVLQEQSQQYKTLNSVEVNHRWELHTENELGVPLAACAMDIQSYQKTSDGTKLHPDDHALLDWKGSLGDTAAEELKIRQDRARAAARAALTGRAMPVKLTANASGAAAKTKKAKFSRVLDEGMQTWMKKTTYLSNDYSRKVHDFKSLAKTKQELAEELEQKRLEISKKRSAAAIAQSFDTTKIEHPSKKKLKVKRTYPLLPNVQAWGKAHTHIIIDKAPTTTKPYALRDLKKGLIANVEKPEDKPKMACDVFVPAKGVEGEDQYQAVQSYDLDIIPLKDDDSPQMHFCFWIDKDKGLATYLPLPSRVQLSTGRPLREIVYRGVQRRPLTEEEVKEEEERTAEINEELAEKYNLTKTVKPSDIPKGDEAPRKKIIEDGDGDGEDDFGDDDDDDSSDDEAIFGGGTKTIEAQS